MSKVNDEMNFVVSSTKVEKLFGISSNVYWYNRSMTYFIPIKGMEKINKCDLLDKDEVFLFLKQSFNMYCLKNYEIYVSCEPVNMHDIKDYFGKEIFTEQQDCNGWLIFVDPSSDANWSHKCQYWFVVNCNNVLKEQNENWPPLKSLTIEKLDIREWGVK